jgi:2'-5' RNA ligase
MFPSTDDENYAAIVAEVEDQHLEEAHQRLSYLPHVNTFAQYRPHMTLCYVRLETAQKWMDVLNEAQFHIYVTEGLDYGSEK